MTMHAPRKNANGDSAMRPIRSGIKLSSRPTLLASTVATGSARSAGGVHAACDLRGVCSRRALPYSNRVCRESNGRAGSYGAVVCQNSRSPSRSRGAADGFLAMTVPDVLLNVADAASVGMVCGRR